MSAVRGASPNDLQAHSAAWRAAAALISGLGMRARAAALLLVIAMIATNALRSADPVWSDTTPTATCSQAQAESNTPYAAPQYEGRALHDLVSRANASSFAAVLPVIGNAEPRAAVGAVPFSHPRRSPRTPRHHAIRMRDRVQPGANDPA